MSPEEGEGREDTRFLALEVVPGLAHPSLGVSLLGPRPHQFMNSSLIYARRGSTLSQRGRTDGLNQASVSSRCRV